MAAVHTHVDEDELSAYVDSELAPRRRRQVEAAIAACAECQASRQELVALADDLRELGSETPPAELMPPLPQRANGGGRRFPAAAGLWPPRVPGPRVAAGLALVTLAVGLGLYRLGGGLPGAVSRPPILAHAPFPGGTSFVPLPTNLGDLPSADRVGVSSGSQSLGSSGLGGAALSLNAQPGSAAGPAAAPATQDAPRIVRTGRVDVQVRVADFDRSITTVNDIGATLSGYVASSDVSEGGSRTASITLRVPADRFQDALTRLRAVGTVTAYSVQGQDVTQQFVDNQARLASLKAQVAAMTRLLDRATSVSDIIAIQGQLAPLQTQVEQTQAQINYLNDSTTFATINMSISQVPGPGSAPWSGITDALGRAGHGFMGTVEAGIVAAGTVAPILLLVGGLLLILVTRRRGTIPAVPGEA